MKKIFILAILIFTTSIATAGTVEPLEFDNSTQEAAYKELIAELRCLVCQNQNIADSNADLAKDLRAETYKMLRSGKDKQAVIDFMVNRYGNFVLYRPPLISTTYLLWGAPLILGIIGLIILIINLRSHVGKNSLSSDLSDEEKHKIQNMLDKQNGKTDS